MKIFNSCATALVFATTAFASPPASINAANGMAAMLEDSLSGNFPGIVLAPGACPEQCSTCQACAWVDMNSVGCREISPSCDTAHTDTHAMEARHHIKNHKQGMNDMNNDNSMHDMNTKRDMNDMNDNHAMHSSEDIHLNHNAPSHLSLRSSDSNPPSTDCKAKCTYCTGQLCFPHCCSPGDDAIHSDITKVPTGSPEGAARTYDDYPLTPPDDRPGWLFCCGGRMCYYCRIDE